MLSSQEDPILLKVVTKGTVENGACVYSSEDDIVKFREFSAPPAVATGTSEPTMIKSDPPPNGVSVPSNSENAEAPRDQVENEENLPVVKADSPKRLHIGFFGRIQRPKSLEGDRITAPAPRLFARAFKPRAKDAKARIDQKEESLREEPHVDTETVAKQVDNGVSIAAVIDEKVVVENVDGEHNYPPAATSTHPETTLEQRTSTITVVDHRSSRKVETIGKSVVHNTAQNSGCFDDSMPASENPPERKVGRRVLAQFVASRFIRAPKAKRGDVKTDKDATLKLDPQEPELVVIGEEVVKDSTESALNDAQLPRMPAEEPSERTEENAANEKFDDVAPQDGEPKLSLQIATDHVAETVAREEQGDAHGTLASMTDALMAWCTPRGIPLEIFGDKQVLSIVEQSENVDQGEPKRPASCNASQVDMSKCAPDDSVRAVTDGVMAWCSPRNKGISSGQVGPTESKKSEVAAVSSDNGIELTIDSAQANLTSVATTMMTWCSPRGNGEITTNGEDVARTFDDKTTSKKSFACSEGVDETMDSTQESMSSMTSTVAAWCTPRGRMSGQKGMASLHVLTGKETSNITVMPEKVDADGEDAIKQINTSAFNDMTCSQVPKALEEAQAQMDGLCGTNNQRDQAVATSARSQPLSSAAGDSVKTWASNLANWWSPKMNVEGTESSDKGMFVNCECVDVVADNAACVEEMDDMSIGDAEGETPLAELGSKMETPLAQDANEEEKVVEDNHASAPSSAPTSEEVQKRATEEPIQQHASQSRTAGRFKKAFRNPFGALKRTKQKEETGERQVSVARETSVPELEPQKMPKITLSPIAKVNVEEEKFQASESLPNGMTTSDAKLEEVVVDTEDVQENFSRQGTAISLDSAIGDSLGYLALVQGKREARSKRVASLVEDVEVEPPAEELENATNLSSLAGSTPTTVKRGYRRVGFRRQTKQSQAKAKSHSDRPPAIIEPESKKLKSTESLELDQHMRVCAVSDEEVEGLEMEASFSTSAGSHFPAPPVQSEPTETNVIDRQSKVAQVANKNASQHRSQNAPELAKNTRGKDEISMGPGMETFDDDLSGVFAPTGGGKWFW
jgi:DNA-binding protein YbaB